jgi:hypothetical protein
MTRKERNIRITREFEAEHDRIPFNLHEVYAWAVAKNLWYAPIDLAEKKFVAEMADALRDEYITTDDGEKVRYLLRGHTRQSGYALGKSRYRSARSY